MVGSPKKRARKEAQAKGETIPVVGNVNPAAGLNYDRMNQLRDQWHLANPPYIAPTPPTQNKSTYKPEFCQAILEHAAIGHSLAATAALIGVQRSTLIEWGLKHRECGIAIARAKEIRLVFYESHLIDVVRRGGDSVRFSAIKMGLINLGKDEWTEKPSGLDDVASLASLIMESMKQPVRLEQLEPIDVTPKSDDPEPDQS